MTIALLGVLIGAVLGGLGLFAPRRALAFVGLTTASSEGLGEVRATYGGLFLVLELSAGYVWLGRHDTAAMLAVGLAWVGAAIGRSLSVVVDGGRTPKNIAGVAFEAVTGALHLLALVG